MSRKQLTAKQHAFLEYLAEHVRQTKVWPTYREIVEEFGYRSPNSVTQNLQALEKKGYLSRDDGGYRLLGQRNGLPGSGFPVQGTVSDGQYETALSIEEVSLKHLFPGLAETFAVRMEQAVRGVDVGEGEYVLLQGSEVPDGTMAVALLCGEAAVVRVLRDNGTLRLQHLDGEEVRMRASASDVRLLGRYAGHINRMGLYRLPGLSVREGALEGAMTTAA